MERVLVSRMTELSFLIELLLNHKLPKATQIAVKERIKEVELYAAKPIAQVIPLRPQNGQAPSMQRAIDEMEAEKQNSPPAPNQIAAQTPAAAEALRKRQEAINIAISGKEEPGRTSPRKF